MTADAATTEDVGVSVLVADTAIGVASDMMLGGNDVEFQKQVQQQAAGPADLPVVVEENAARGIGRGVVRILIMVILVILGVGVWFFMFRLLGNFTTYAILNLFLTYNMARTWIFHFQPNENDNPDQWWWQRWGRTKVILMATHTYSLLVYLYLMFISTSV
jgi:hypothetical protein